jgi:predicted esterase/GNAT superfamily N-acetyltransferase
VIRAAGKRQRVRKGAGGAGGSARDRGGADAAVRTIGGLRCRVQRAPDPAAPILVALHGRGATAEDLADLGSMVAPAYHHVLPDAPLPWPASGRPIGLAWYHRGPGEAAQVGAARAQLSACVAGARSELGGGPLVLLGFSQGALMAMDTGLRHPPPAELVVALSGMLFEDVGDSASPPILVVHGSRDAVVPVRKGREARVRLERRGVRVTYRELPVAHEITPEVIEIVREFIGQVGLGRAPGAAAATATATAAAAAAAEAAAVPYRRELAGGLVVVSTRAEYAGQLEALQELVFPTLAPEQRFRSVHYLEHLQIFPQGQFVVLDGDRVVGMTSTIRMDFDFAHLQHTFDDIIQGGWLTSHQPDGQWLYGADIGTHPDHRRRGVARALYVARHDLVRRLGLRGQVTVGMLSGYGSRRREMSARDYFEAVRSGRITDPTVSAQMKVGFELRALVPGYLHDPVCDDYGACLVLDASRDVRPG